MTIWSRVKTRVLSSVVTRAIMLFDTRDRKRLFLLATAQIALGLLDLAGVAVVGLLGILTVNGVKSVGPQGRVVWVLEQLGIISSSFQFQVAILGLIAASLLLSRTIISIYLGRRALRFLSRRSAKITEELISKLLNQPIDKINSRSSTENLFAVTSGVGTITVGIIGSVIALISDGSLLLIMLVGLIAVDTSVALVSLAGFGGIGYILYKLLNVRIRNLSSTNTDLTIQGNEKILEVIQSYREAYVTNRRDFFVKEIASIRYKMADANADITFYPSISKYVLEVAVVIGALGISASQFLLHDSAHAIATLSVFLAAGTRIAPAVLRAQQGALNIKSSLGTANSTFELITELSQVSSLTQTYESPNFNHEGFSADISLRNVSYTYENESKPAISDANLRIEKGSVVAIVGNSGAGKSTLVDLILGVINPSNGDVKISGLKPSGAIDLWPGAIAYVPQRVRLSNGTIRQNVVRGFNEKLQDESEIFRSLDQAHLYEFTKSQDNQLERNIGEDGGALSGGQRQRLGIARALFTKPKLLILDEATSSLDSETEAAISATLQSLKGQATIVMIAHRLSTVKSADLVVYLEGGKIISIGNFSEVRREVPSFDKQANLLGI